MKLSTPMKWILGVFGSFVLLFLCVAPLAARLIFMGVQHDFNVAEFRERAAPFSQRSQAPNSPEMPHDDDRDGPESRFEGKSESGHGRGFSKHYGDRHMRGFGGFSIFGAIFGLFGGLIRLAGLGLIALAAIIWLKPKAGSNSNKPSETDPDDDAPDLSEADLKAAMKKLGITKLEVDEE